jgi:8-oxo-dGTP diphosphatase
MLEMARKSPESIRERMPAMSRDVDPGLAAFTMVLLCCDDRYLMLQRSPEKLFAPGRWTGIGGRVEPDELDDLKASALREIFEETGYTSEEICHLALRRTLLQQRPQHPVTVLFYFTAEVQAMRSRETREGTLHWLTKAELANIDIIENTRLVIPELIADIECADQGPAGPKSGAASYSPEGELRSIDWAD